MVHTNDHQSGEEVVKFIRWFNTLSMKDISLVGGKNASLGQMIQDLASHNIPIPNGFAITADAYWYYLTYNHLEPKIKAILKALKKDDISSLKKIGKKIRTLLAHGVMPDDLASEIVESYELLSKEYKTKQCDVAVRSSATAEDLPTASFAGQQETYLNIRGSQSLLYAVKKSIASLFTDRAIIYRLEKGFDHFAVALSVGIQKMIRSDKGTAGVAFSIDTDTGFKDVIMINGSYGLGEMVVKGLVNPDEFFVFKPTLQKGLVPIIKKKCGDKKHKLIYGSSEMYPVKKFAVERSQQERFCLSDEQILELARMVMIIEDYYSSLNQKWTPMDVEWAQDGKAGKLYIVQARPETVHSARHRKTYSLFKLKPYKVPKAIVKGSSIGEHIVVGKARLITSPRQMNLVQKGDIIVTTMTDPDWVPIMKKAAGIITDLGGRTCHAAIVSREMGLPALVGTIMATKTIKNGQLITLDCSQGSTGYVYAGDIPFEKKEISCDSTFKSPVPLLLTLAHPEAAFALSSLPVEGVGLARIEFIISSEIAIHPMALAEYKSLQDARLKKIIAAKTCSYSTPQEFFIAKLSQGIAQIAAAFYPKPVIVRLSDFKSNEYRNLIAGELFEHEEANPMLGLRGASRYTSSQYQKAFKLECDAIIRARTTMGLTNIMVMVPFVRTIDEAQRTIALMKRYGLERGRDNLKLVMMCEIPSNVILMKEFARYFDGFSIGSNDLAQLTLGIDRDSAVLASLFDERDPAVKAMIAMAIASAHEAQRFIGICGQAPSDYPEFMHFLIAQGIDSVSLNPDSIFPFLLSID